MLITMPIKIMSSKNRFHNSLMGLLLFLMMTSGVMAETVVITADFQPHVNDKTFHHLSQKGGDCLNKSRISDDGKKLILRLCLPVNTGWVDIQANHDPKHGLYFAGFSSTLELENINDGDSLNTPYAYRQLAFKVTELEVQYNKKEANTNTSEAGVFSCNRRSGDTLCYEILPVNSAVALKNISITAELTLPNPLTMESGIYITNDDLNLDLGETFSPWLPDVLFGLNFYFRISHELRITPQSGANSSVLLAPKQGWENISYNEKKPISLTARSNFGISSSGPFTVYLKCDQTEEEHCAIRSDRDPSITVPVESYLTLPVNINQEKVNKQLLKVGKDLENNIFNTINRVQNGSGHIDFKVKPFHVDNMIKRGADTYRGTVTVIFDSDLCSAPLEDHIKNEVFERRVNDAAMP